jgi:hypothetical protein
MSVSIGNITGNGFCACGEGGALYGENKVCRYCARSQALRAQGNAHVFEPMGEVVDKFFNYTDSLFK